MISRLRRARLLAVAGCLTSAAAATAVDATPPPVPLVGTPSYVNAGVGCGGCEAPAGPVLGGVTGLGAAGTGIGLFAPNPPWWHKRHRIDGQNQPACAVNSYPLSDWAYIRKYCGPTVIPGTCYGHFQTKWRKWEDHCPTGAVGCDPASALPSVQAVPLTVLPPTVQPPTAPSVILPPPVPLPPPPLPLPKADEPKKDLPKVDIPKTEAPDEPKKPKTADLGVQLPPIPVLEVPTPGALPPLPLLETRR